MVTCIALIGPSGSGKSTILAAADPKILILDEPTAHLDEATERAILADLLTGTTGRTVLFSTHRALRPDHVDTVAGISGRRLEVVPEPASIIRTLGLQN